VKAAANERSEAQQQNAADAQEAFLLRVHEVIE